jgi:hypothetical protein
VSGDRSLPRSERSNGARSCTSIRSAQGARPVRLHEPTSSERWGDLVGRGVARSQSRDRPGAAGPRNWQSASSVWRRGVELVELVAYVGDVLSAHQDEAAAEGCLDTDWHEEAGAPQIRLDRDLRPTLCLIAWTKAASTSSSLIAIRRASVRARRGRAVHA